MTREEEFVKNLDDSSRLALKEVVHGAAIEMLLQHDKERMTSRIDKGWVELVLSAASALSLAKIGARTNGNTPIESRNVLMAHLYAIEAIAGAERGVLVADFLIIVQNMSDLADKVMESMSS